MDWVVCWNRVMACGISNQYFLSFITVTWTAHSILIENNLIKNLTVKRDWELWMRLLVRIHQLGCSCISAGVQLYISWSCSCTSAGPHTSAGMQLSPGISELGAARAASCRGGTLPSNTSNRSPLSAQDCKCLFALHLPAHGSCILQIYHLSMSCWRWLALVR